MIHALTNWFFLLVLIVAIAATADLVARSLPRIRAALRRERNARYR